MPCATTSGESETLENGEQKSSGGLCSQAHHGEDKEKITETTVTPEVKSADDQAEKSEKVETQETEASKGSSEEEQVKKESEEENKQDVKRAQDNTIEEKQTPQEEMKAELEEWSKTINDAIGAAGDGRGRGRILFPVL